MRNNDGRPVRYQNMARHGFGRGEYKYMARPLPDLVHYGKCIFRFRPSSCLMRRNAISTVVS
jgi:hypothetical protein